jgi:nucleoside-diphosphate-sugar epimerase
MSAPGISLVLGATGVTGTPFAEQLLEAGWAVYGVSRRRPVLKPTAPLGQFKHLPADLENMQSLQDALRACPDVTHVFHCANAGTGIARLQSMTNLLDALEAAAPRLRNINLLQGMKYYGCHLGPFRTPAREDDPRSADDEYYYDEEDLVRQRQAGKAWTWTALRPHSVCGYAAGNPLNLALVLAVYASICRERGEPLWFPASDGCFRSLFQVMDAERLARAAIHVSTNESCGNNAYNAGNGDIFRWQNLWPAIAAAFKLIPKGPGRLPLADFLEHNKAAWSAAAARHGLREFPIDRAASWVRGDYALPNSRFACEYDLISDTVKLRRAGFTEAAGSDAMFLELFARYRAERIIP